MGVFVGVFLMGVGVCRRCLGKGGVKEKMFEGGVFGERVY